MWPSLRSLICESSSLSSWSFPFQGQTPISHLFLSWRLCRSHSLIPSLAPSWWCPCPLVRWALLTLSDYVLSVPSFFFASGSWVDPVALSPLSRSVFADGSRHLCAVAFAEGHRPIRWAPSVPMGLAVTPPVSPSTGPGQSPHFAVRPWGPGQCFILFLRNVPQVFMAIKFVSFTDLCVSRPTHSLRVVFIGHLQIRVTGLA